MQSPVLCKGLEFERRSSCEFQKKVACLWWRNRGAAGWIFLAPATIMIDCHEFLSDDPCIYHLFTDRCRSKYEVCGSDLTVTITYHDG